ncbi:hypothetical protein FRC12_015652 [Ceratobasidium sp. 428]|nr:hypothetical protein FRC12_015652 [Ceratobasidium sp. 428]
MDPAFCSGLELSRFDFAKEWRATSNLLATSMKRYVDACRLLRDIYLEPTRVLDNTSPIWDVFNDMDRELTRLEAYQSELRQVRVEVSLIRNRSSKLAPVMLLPHEVLAYIFELVVITEYRGYRIQSRADKLPVDTHPTHPSALSSVCTYWRQITTNTPSLWGYINLVASGLNTQQSYARASQFISRASNTPLFIRIHYQAPTSVTDDVQRLTNWLTPIANRIYSLDMSGGRSSKEMLRSVLQCWFEHGTPGTVKELSIPYCACAEHEHYRFIEPTPALYRKSWKLDISPQRFEEFFQPIVIVRLEGLFPPWNSQAYHGLIHLRLDTGRIKQAELMNLLSRNPQLRTLSFNLWITDRQSPWEPVAHVHLPRLEILNLKDMQITNVWMLLRLIDPGSSPLKLSLAISEEPWVNSSSLAHNEDFLGFIRRSNVTALHLTGAMGAQDIWFPQFLSIFPRLHSLALKNYSLTQRNTGEYDRVCLSLHVLCLISGEIEISLLERLLRVRSIQVLRVSGCETEGDGEPIEELPDTLSALVPNVKCYRTSDRDCSDPYLNWGFVDF